MRASGKVLLCAHCDMGTLLSAGLSGKVLLCVGRSDMGTLLSAGQSGLEVLLCGGVTWRYHCAHCGVTWGRCSVQGRVARCCFV